MVKFRTRFEAVLKLEGKREFTDHCKIIKFYLRGSSVEPAKGDLVGEDN